MNDLKTESEIAKALYLLLESLRGAIPANEFIEPIVMLAVIKQLEPELFDDVTALPVTSQKDQLLALIGEAKALAVYDFASIDRHALTAGMLKAMVYFMNEIESLTTLADVVYDAHFAMGGRHAGDAATEPSIAELIKRFVWRDSKAVVFDGAAGLCSVVSRLGTKNLLLQDILPAARNVGQGLLTLKDKKFNYALGNSLLMPEPSANADWVIMQPPWGMRLQADNLEKLKNSKFLAVRGVWKLPTSAADALWIQFALYNANNSGKSVLVLPQGWTFRGGYDAKLRAYLLNNDLVESITALPAGLHSHTAIASLILVLNKNKTEDQQGVVKFIDASKRGKRERRKVHLTDADLDLIVSMMQGELVEHELLSTITLSEIYRNKNSLNFKEYFAHVWDVAIPNYKQEKAKLDELQKAAEGAHAKLLKTLP